MSSHSHSHDAVELTSPTWRDPKRYAWLLGLLVPLLPFMAWGLVEATGLGVLWFWGPIFVFVVMPVLDTLIGKDSDNPPDSVVKWLEQGRYYRGGAALAAPLPPAPVVKWLEQDRYYRWCTYLFIPLQFIALVGGVWLLAGGGLDTIEKIGLALTLGCVNGVGINTAHELGHKRASLERWLSKIALPTTGPGALFCGDTPG